MASADRRSGSEGQERVPGQVRSGRLTVKLLAASLFMPCTANDIQDMVRRLRSMQDTGISAICTFEFDRDIAPDVLRHTCAMKTAQIAGELFKGPSLPATHWV